MNRITPAQLLLWRFTVTLYHYWFILTMRSPPSAKSRNLSEAVLIPTRRVSVIGYELYKARSSLALAFISNSYFSG